jgi:hypothetical protein
MICFLTALALSQTISHAPSATHELSEATIVKAYWKDQLPKVVREIEAGQPADLFIELKHEGKGPFYIPMRSFWHGADSEFVLHPTTGRDLRLTAATGTFSEWSDDPGGGDRTFVRLNLHQGDRAEIRHGTRYTLIPKNSHSRHLWRTSEPIKVWIP